MKLVYAFYQSGIEGKGNIDIFTPMRELSNHGHSVHLVCVSDCPPHIATVGSGQLALHPIIPRIPIVLLALIPLIVKLRKICKDVNPDLLVSSGDWNIPIISYIVSRITHVPIVIVFRGMPFEGIYYDSDRNLILRAISIFFMRINYAIFRRLPHLIGASEGLQRYYSEALDRKDVQLINLECVDPKRFKPIQEVSYYRRKLGIGVADYVVLYSGGIFPSKRVRDLVRAFGIVKENLKIPLKVVIAGYGNEKERIVNDVKESGWSDWFIFPEWIPSEDMPATISLADICVETFPRSKWPFSLTPADKILEYMACGRCVIATNSESHRIMINNGIDGLIYFPDDEGKNLASKIATALEDLPFKEKLAVAARTKIEKEYDVAKVVPKFEEFCDRIIHSVG